MIDQKQLHARTKWKDLLATELRLVFAARVRRSPYAHQLVLPDFAAASTHPLRSWQHRGRRFGSDRHDACAERLGTEFLIDSMDTKRSNSSLYHHIQIMVHFELEV